MDKATRNIRAKIERKGYSLSRAIEVFLWDGDAESLHRIDSSTSVNNGGSEDGMKFIPPLAGAGRRRLPQSIFDTPQLHSRPMAFPSLATLL